VEIQNERLSVAQRIAEVLEMMADGREMAFEDLFRDSREINDVVITFLAILELVQLRLIRVWQVDAYGAIRIVTVPAGSEGLEPQLFGEVAGADNGKHKEEHSGE
jgi:segregation and condensation protein A